MTLLAIEDLRIDLVTGGTRHAALARIEIDAQILDLDQRIAHTRVLRDWGSRMSRRPSPSRLRPSTVRKIASPGKTESHGAVVIWSRASDSILPQLG